MEIFLQQMEVYVQGSGKQHGSLSEGRLWTASVVFLNACMVWRRCEHISHFSAVQKNICGLLPPCSRAQGQYGGQRGSWSQDFANVCRDGSFKANGMREKKVQKTEVMTNLWKNTKVLRKAFHPPPGWVPPMRSLARALEVTSSKPSRRRRRSALCLSSIDSSEERQTSQPPL